MKKTHLLLIAGVTLVSLTNSYQVFAKQEDKVYWCHTEPNGNQQTLHLPLEALENAGHVNAQGNPLHAGDHAGECIEATPEPSPSIEPSPTPEVTPSPEPTTEPTPSPSINPSPTPSPSPLSTPQSTPSPTPTLTVEEQQEKVIEEVRRENPEQLGVMGFK